MMSTHKLTAGDGYLYLIRQTAAADSDKGRASLSDYYSANGESPGRWVGRGLAGLATPLGREPLTEAAAGLWKVEPGSQVTEDQMKALFGLGLHPNATQIVEHLVTVHGLSKNPAIDAAKLGRPFTVNDGDTPLQQRLAIAYRDHNLSRGDRWNAPIPDAIRAAIRTAIARQMFGDEYGRPPRDARELSGFIARGTRQLTTSVAGYDLTFTPVKSVSALWAIAPLEISKRIEQAHDRAVADVLEFLQDNAAFTRTGAHGVAQVDTDGFIAAVFTHRDTRAGDPGLHTHVAVSNKVRAGGADGIPRWLALDGRPLFKTTVAASEMYNTRVEGYLTEALGVRFACRAGHAADKRPVREIVGMPADLTALWSSRRAAVEQRYAELSKRFHTDHGREPTTIEAIALHQQATLETRQAKHEPRSLAEQRHLWRTQAIEVLGSQAALSGLLAHVMCGRREPAHAISPAWIAEQARRVIDTVSHERAVWQPNHVYAEAQRRVRETGQAADRSLAAVIASAALSDYSVAIGTSPDANLGEPAQLRRRNGATFYQVHDNQQFTSTEILAAERRILAAARRRDGRTAHPEDVELAIDTQGALRHELNTGQQELVREMATCGTRVALALAPAGTGKTTAMATLAQAWEQGGGTVIGLAPSASAAEVLRGEIRVDATDTVAKYLWLHHNPDRSDDPARGWFDTIGPDTLIIVDEAGKCGTLDLDTVIGHAIACGASVRLIGDDQQLTSISAGGVLRDLREEHGARTLVEVVRFADRSEALATISLRDGDPAAIGYLIDNGRVHVGADATAAELAYSAWRADRAAGHDALLLAPTNDLVAALNERARYDRLAALAADHPSATAVAEAVLADDLRVSAGDLVCTRRNARWLRISATDYVRNGYRWRVDEVTDGGALRVAHLQSGRRVRLPADYVAAHVTLGYATTIDAAQGVTAATCHIVGSDTLTRQMLYVAMTRGRYRNDIYLSTAETDPHRVLAPKATHPDTAVDVLTRVLARNNEQVSATTAQRHADDPFKRLKHAAAAYLDALGQAAVSELGREVMAGIDRGAEAALPGLTAQTAWPLLRQHLAMIAIAGDDPMQRLHHALGDRELDTAREVAAVLDWRLDHSGSHSAGAGPLRWQPSIPAALAPMPEWACLQRRYERVAELADAIRAIARSWTERDAPPWARPLIGTHPRLVAEIAVFRAATGVPDQDSRIAGPQQYPVRTRAVQGLLQRQAAAVIGRPDTGTCRWNAALDAIDPHIRRDPYFPQLAARLGTAARTGVDIRQLLADAVARGPLPDQLPAAALWWRLAGTLSPPTLEGRGSGLRPAWMADLHAVFGSALAETIVADPAWPGLVAAVSAADRSRWTPLDLLNVALEHLRDADPEDVIRPDEYARLLTYSIDLFTTDHLFLQDVPVPEEPPPTPEEDEQLRGHVPDPEIDFNGATLVDAVGFAPASPRSQAAELRPPDPLGCHYDDDLGDLRFEDLPTRRPASWLLHPALPDVHLLRRQAQQIHDVVAELEADPFCGPAMRAAMPRIRELRERAATDRPYLIAVQQVLAQWADADERHAEVHRQIAWAEAEVERLRTDGADELDILSAESQARFWRTHLPTTSPAERFYDAFTAAVTARAEAAGGADRIVTDEDADSVIQEATESDFQALRDARSRLRRVSDQLGRAEAAAAAAFAAAETHSAEHILDQADALRTELAVLETAGGFRLERQLSLPPTATDHLPDLTARGLSNLAASAYTVTPVHAGDDSTAIEAMQVLHAAAAARDRKVLWCSPSEERADRVREARVAETVVELPDAHQRLGDGTWRLPAGSLVVIDHASEAEPSIIAEMASRAEESGARLIMLDPEEQRWPPGPSAALIKLLHKDLPWAVTLSVSDTTPARRPPQPDIDPVLDQADRLHSELLSAELRDAIAKRQQLRAEHGSSYRVHNALRQAADRDASRGTDYSRQL